jgi:serine protease Do
MDSEVSMSRTRLVGQKIAQAIGLCAASLLALCVAIPVQAAPEAKSPRASNIDLRAGGLFPTEVVGPAARHSLVTVEAVGLPFSGASTASPFQRTVRKIGGSGFIVSTEGHIITSPYTVRDAKLVNVTVDGETYDAKIIAEDEFYEISLLKIDDPDARGIRFDPVEWGSSGDMKVGMPIVVMGSPAALDKTMTYGFVTNRRDIRLRGAGGLSTGVLVPYAIEIDAAIVPSNYGGPVFNDTAHVVGIVNRWTGRESGQQNMNYAVPSDIAKPILDQMIAKGRAFHPWFGIEPFIPYNSSKNLAIYIGVPTRKANPDTGEPYGIVGYLVNSVSTDSPAAQAGLIKGDLLLKFNGQLIKDTKFLELRILELKQGQSFTLTIIRNGVVINKRITIADRPTIKEMQEAGIKPQFYGI